MRLPTLLADQRDAIALLCRRSRARSLDLFGSAARGAFDSLHSDLDFLVAFEELPPIEYSDAYFTLKEGLERLLARPVDLVVEQAIRNPHFMSRVQAERLPVYAA
jgi:predicted nucleotidyltransferase